MTMTNNGKVMSVLWWNTRQESSYLTPWKSNSDAKIISYSFSLNVFTKENTWQCKTWRIWHYMNRNNAPLILPLQFVPIFLDFTISHMPTKSVCDMGGSQKSNILHKKEKPQLESPSPGSFSCILNIMHSNKQPLNVFITTEGWQMLLH